MAFKEKKQGRLWGFPKPVCFLHEQNQTPGAQTMDLGML